MKKILVVLFTLFALNSLLASEEVTVVVYEKELEGILTTSGDYFSHKELTAGHESLPMGSIIEIINPANNKRVELTVNDRILDTNGMYWISGSAADILEIKSIYPTKAQLNILYKPEIKEVYEEELPTATEPVYVHSNLTTVGYTPNPLPPTPIPNPPAQVKTSTPNIVTITPSISQSTQTSPILEGLSENLETAIGDPRIPKSVFSQRIAYGVHIYTTVNSTEAIEVSQRLYNYFSCPSYIEKYYSPLGNCYRVIAGDYKNEAEAIQWYNKLLSSIPDIFLVEIY